MATKYVNENIMLDNIEGMLEYCEKNPEVSAKTALLAMRDCVLTNSTAYVAPVLDTAFKMRDRLTEKIDRTINVFDFEFSECRAVRQVLRGFQNDIYQITKELVEEQNDG